MKVLYPNYQYNKIKTELDNNYAESNAIYQIVNDSYYTRGLEYLPILKDIESETIEIATKINESPEKYEETLLLEIKIDSILHRIDFARRAIIIAELYSMGYTHEKDYPLYPHIEEYARKKNITLYL
jgi:hypothetical protein